MKTTDILKKRGIKNGNDIRKTKNDSGTINWMES